MWRLTAVAKYDSKASCLQEATERDSGVSDRSLFKYRVVVVGTGPPQHGARRTHGRTLPDAADQVRLEGAYGSGIKENSRGNIPSVISDVRSCTPGPRLHRYH